MIEARMLSRSYSGVPAVRGVDFEVHGGEIVGLLGPNGAGKSTVLRMLTGILRPDSGRIRYNGEELAESMPAIKARIGYLPESAPVYGELTTAEYLDFLAGGRGLEGKRRRSAIEAVCEECALTDAVYRPMAKLSKGYRQRAALAGALVHDPEFLILDEPTTGLDPEQIAETRELIRRLGRDRTVLLSTHILQEAEALCSRVYIMSAGLIAAEGRPGALTGAGEGAVRFLVTVKDAAPEALRAELPGIQGFRGLERIYADESASGSTAVVVCEAADGDGSAIFGWAVARGYRLSALYPLRTSLEEQYLQVQRGRDAQQRGRDSQQGGHSE
jgi:ABC-2 type transport system ATP-binding protein